MNFGPALLSPEQALAPWSWGSAVRTRQGAGGSGRQGLESRTELKLLQRIRFQHEGGWGPAEQSGG